MSPYSKRYAKGFTLVELLVSISIMAIILTVVAINQSRYTETSALSNLADDISLTLAQAQAYGIAVKELTPGSSDFSASYGLTWSLLSSGSNSAYLFFADRNGNNIYDGDWGCTIGGASECQGKTIISRGNYIEDICIVSTNSTEQCDSALRVDASFVRPNTEARLVFFDGGGNVFNPSNLKGARIVLKSPSGLSRSVLIYQSGQISVQ